MRFDATKSQPCPVRPAYRCHAVFRYYALMVTQTSLPHRLDPLLNPRSVAVVGASGRPGRPGYDTLRALSIMNFKGAVYPVTPTYPAIDGYKCYPDMEKLPQQVDLAVIAGSSARMEQQLEQAFRCGARAALVFANANERVDTDSGFRDRIAALAHAANAPLAGPYTIGFVNHARRVAASWVPPKETHIEPGGIVALIQSGSTYAFSLTTDPRMRFALVVHPGQELDVTVAEYMDYALRMPETRVIGLFLETIRDPDGFLQALSKAEDRGIPIVVLKMGRSEAGARHVISHAGRLAGSEQAFQAVVRRYGVFRAYTMEEWWATILMLSHTRAPGEGGVAAITDSGGQRALLSDLASDIGLEWASISDATKSRIAQRLDPTLMPENPLDAWGGDPDWPQRFKHHFEALMDDPATAIGVMFTEYSSGPNDPMSKEMANVCIEVASQCNKPVVAAQFTARHFYRDAIDQLTTAGVPVLDGGRNTLIALKRTLEFRDRSKPCAPTPIHSIDSQIVTKWRERLQSKEPLNEHLALSMLGELGLSISRSAQARCLDEAIAVAERIGYPVVLKTAQQDLTHKSEHNGVHLNLCDPGALRDAYSDISTRLGAAVLIAEMVEDGTEIALGMTRDQQFGPIVMVGAGGVWVELFNDACFVLPPFDESGAQAALRELTVFKLLRGFRGRPPADLYKLAALISRFSVIATEFSDIIAEIDINPVIAGANRCTAVDALIVPLTQT
ncbi:MAG: acetate--CoA ligase family protein [Gammaproteobacteria bacterium]|nr:acetate--CoA ligase family protein [Gammaproteobacteria bacterium]